MNLNDELLERIDNYAKLNYMNRSSVVSFACNQFLMANEMQSLIIDMKRALQVIANNENISAEDLKELEKYENLCDLLIKNHPEKL
jgi:metal-responsive CopG/Arc/MetJ family transcriptional regulator